LGVIAYFLFSTHDAANKFLAASLPVWQILFFRSAIVVIALFSTGRGALAARSLNTRHKIRLTVRSACTLVAWLCYYTASRDMPLAQLMTLYFMAPVMVALMAIPLLGERVPGPRWAALGLSFLGVCLASDPFGLHLSTATFLVVFAASLWAYSTILMRQIAPFETGSVQMVYQNVLFLVITGSLSALFWVPPTPLGYVLLVGVGVFGGGGQMIMFQAIRHAPASVMSTVEYTGLIWAFLLGYIVWGDVPSLATSVGAGLIFASGIYLVVMERRRGVAC